MALHSAGPGLRLTDSHIAVPGTSLALAGAPAISTGYFRGLVELISLVDMKERLTMRLLSRSLPGTGKIHPVIAATSGDVRRFFT
ncbi:MAG: hypothetical protein OEN55_01815 [Alphaproteobacteria bacterium]|nr:hypothetical protein [Alphaproteobacteria bacterium]